MEKRKELVRKAMPDAYHRNFAPIYMQFDFERKLSGAISSASMAKADQGKKESRVKAVFTGDSSRGSKTLHLLSYLDLQTLSEDPMSLLAILHHRSHSDLASWAMFDMDALRVPFNCVHGVYNPHCVISKSYRGHGSLVETLLTTAFV